jgi:hypothetical protein
MAIAHAQPNPNGRRARRPPDVHETEQSSTAYTGPPLRSKAALGRFLATARIMGASADVVEAAQKG